MTKILILEDETHIRQNISEILALEGFTPLEAENGFIGVQLAREHLPDLIICDIMMPELDGYGVISELRGDPTTSTIPFIFLTALADKYAMRQGMDLGADDYLTKPFTPAELMTAVTVRLDKQANLAGKYEQKLDELRDELISTLPHELRTPLTGIMGYSELLMTDGNTLPGSQIVKMATLIHQSSLRLHQLFEKYLLYAQIEIARSNADRVKTLRTRVTENAQEIIQNIAQQKAYQAERENDLFVEVANAQLQISEDNLEHIVRELIDNALKFSQRGSVIHISGVIDGSVFALRISDQGRGMTAEQIRDVGAYMQFERKLYEQQGSGLGLIIAKRLASLFGGELTIESTLGQQTSVLVLLPLA